MICSSQQAYEAADTLDELYQDGCALCPRNCGARRTNGAVGLCGAGGSLRIARASLHHWEEPPVSGSLGSGTVFFSNCPLKCTFCQNVEISDQGFGTDISVERLCDIYLELQEQGAHNINFVSATQYAHQAARAVGMARERGLTLPIVYNTSGYESAACVRALGPVIDVWLTDFKYASRTLATKYSRAANYPHTALAAIMLMAAVVDGKGGTVYEDELIKQGVIVRHLVMPTHADDSIEAMRMLWDGVGNSVELSVMNQFTPMAAATAKFPELGRSVTDVEYESVLDVVEELGFETCFWQEGGAVDESFIPPFDSTGVFPVS